MHDIKTERPRISTLSLSLGQALRASDEILELLPVATCICDLEGRIIQYNRRAVEIWGRKPNPGETHEQFSAATKYFGTDGSLLPRSRINQVLETGKSVRDEEVTVIRPDGARLAMLLNIDPLFDAAGKMIGAINCIQNITERQRVMEALGQSQQDLRQQEQRWAATYEHAAIGIVEIDADGRFLRVNEAIIGMVGYTREELLGRRLFARTHPSDAQVDVDLYRRQVAGDLNYYSIERRFFRKDGSVIWCSVRSSSVCDAEGNFLYTVRVIQDITDRKVAEERQKLLIDELNHRVKNTLATVQSLAAQTAHGVTTPQEFRDTFEGRLIALSQAHDLLTRRHWRSADLHDTIAGALSPYMVGGRDQTTIEGESVTVTPRAALTLALVFHELTTNAAKYGALSTPAGRIEVRWRIMIGPSKPPLLWVEWRERDGPVVAAPTHQGFGSRFIEGSVQAELQGTARLQYAAAGVRCLMEIPLDAALLDADAKSD